MIQNEVSDLRIIVDNYTRSICEVCQWSHSAHSGPAPITSFCERPLLGGQEEQTPHTTGQQLMPKHGAGNTGRRQ